MEGGVGGIGGEHAITNFVSHDGSGEYSLNSFEGGRVVEGVAC